MKTDTPLTPEVVGMDIVTGHQYSKCRATVTLDISDGNGGREEMVVEYPVQNDRHLTMLMQKKITIGDGAQFEEISHPDKQKLSAAIKDIVSKKE